MKINIIDKSRNKRSKDITLKDGMIFVHLEESEAINLIRSLSTQISKRDPNSERLESYTQEGTYFSIAVTDFRMSQMEYDHQQRKRELYNSVDDQIKKIKGERG